MAEKRIFREAALDRLASPEQLDRLVTVADARGWLALSLAAALTAAAFIWAFIGSVPSVLSSTGMLVQAGQPKAGLEAVLYLPATTGKSVEPGMQVRLAPTHVQSETHGTLSGTVRELAPFPVALPGSNGGRMVYEARVDLDRDQTSANGLRWSARRGAALALSPGTLLDAEVTLLERRPVELLFPSLRTESAR